MWSSRLFWKLFLAYAGLVLVVVSACVAIVSGWQEDILIKQIYRRLRDSATMMANEVREDLPNGSSEQMQNLVMLMGKQTDTRFTVADGNGTVLADSSQENLEGVANMENHKSRPEFIEAARKGKGSARRASATVGLPFLYFTLAVKEGDQLIGYVRAAQFLSTILNDVSRIRRLLWMVGLLVGLFGLAVTYLLTRRILLPIQSLSSATENIAAGTYPMRIDVKTHDELGQLARSFEQMSSELSTRENQLRESNDRQRTVLSGMIEGVLAVDKHEHILFANKSAGQMLGFDPDSIKDRSLIEVVRSNDLREIVQRALATNLLVQGEIEWQVADSMLILEVHATPIPGDPCPGVIIVLDDNTELKRLEGVRQEFVANVSHELKTPLSAIKAYTETLLRGAINDEENAGRFLNRIDEQTDRLNELVQDMLAIGKLETGQQTMEFTNVELEPLVQKCFATYEARAEKAKIALIQEIENAQSHVYADEEGLLQILNNLLDNALKYTPTDGTITLRSKAVEGEAIIEIADTGVGIAPEHHDRLFERFYRVDKARSRELGGTGLGLSIVKHLCQSMGGTVSVDSTLGKGTTFCIRIPLADA